MVGAGSSGPGSSPGRGQDTSLSHFFISSCSAELVKKWVPANTMLGPTIRWTSIPTIKGGGGGGEAGSRDNCMLLASTCNRA